MVAPREKMEVLEKLEFQTTRAAEKIVFQIEPEMKPKKNPLNFDSIKDEALREKLIRVKNLFAHTDPYMTLEDLLHKLCDQEIAKKTQRPGAPKVNSKAEIRRQFRKRDQEECINCGSTYAVQEEHRIPKAVGGQYTLCACSADPAINATRLSSTACLKCQNT